MDIVEKVIEKIRNDPEIKRARFNDELLNSVGAVFSRHGYGAARVFAMGDDNEAKALLRVLDILEEMNLSIELGTLILKKLNAIKKKEVNKCLR